MLYLIVAGSIVAFTAYVWLIHHESPTKVGTYAYVNPLVAVLLGYFMGGEALGLRTILGTLFVLISRGDDHHDASEEAGRGSVTLTLISHGLPSRRTLRVRQGVPNGPAGHKR